MTDTTTRTLLVIGAGPGVGAATAHRFGREGFQVGLVARNRDRLATLTDELVAQGVTAQWCAADITVAADLRGAISALTERLGDPDVVCVSALPDFGRIKPVLETTPDDLAASFGLTVVGAATAVAAVLPAMRRRGTGTLLFTTGSAALRPSPDRAASGVTTTAATVWISMLHEALGPEGIQVAHVTIAGAIGPGERHRPEDVAAQLWQATLDRSTASVLLD